MDVLLEIDQTVLDSVLEGLLKLLVQLLHKFEPLLLDVLLTGQEQLLVNGEELLPDNLKVINKGLLLQLQLRLLLLHELLELVESSLLDLGQDCRGDDLELVHNLGVARLEVIDLLVVFEAVSSALINKGVCLSKPVEPTNTRLNELIERGQMVIEEFLLLLVDDLHDAVVVAHDEHDVLTQDAQLFLTGVQLDQRLRESDKTVRLYLVPVLNFKQQLQQVSVEVRFKQVRLLLSKQRLGALVLKVDVTLIQFVSLANKQ